MSRSRLCALVLVPLLVAGAAACGGEENGTTPERRAAADAAFRTSAATGGRDVTCRDWRDASPAMRAGLIGGFIEPTPMHADPWPAAEAETVLDRECLRVPDASFFDTLPAAEAAMLARSARTSRRFDAR